MIETSIDAQNLAPYTALASGSAPARTTILISRHTLPFLAIVPLLRAGHYIPASVALVAFLSEVVIVTLAGLPFRPGQTRAEYLACAATSLVILLLMVIELVVMAWWRALVVPHLPRRPDNIAAVMTYLAGSDMNADFAGLETSGVKERNARIEALGRRYKYCMEGGSGVHSGEGRWLINCAPSTGIDGRRMMREGP
jgi:hypothetical protein